MTDHVPPPPDAPRVRYIVIARTDPAWASEWIESSGSVAQDFQWAIVDNRPPMFVDGEYVLDAGAVQKPAVIQFYERESDARRDCREWNVMEASLLARLRKSHKNATGKPVFKGRRQRG